MIWVYEAKEKKHYAFVIINLLFHSNSTKDVTMNADYCYCHGDQVRTILCVYCKP